MPEPNGSPQALSEVGVIPDASTIPVLQEFDFNLNALRRKRLSEEKAKIEDELKSINDTLCAALIAAAIKSVRCGKLRVTRVDGRGPSVIKKELLLEAGVSADIIVGATIPGREYTTVQVTEIKDKAA